jgi:hypothetical protein
MHFRTFPLLFPVLLCAAIGMQGCSEKKTEHTITATQPQGYPALNPADFSDEYCSVWLSTIGSPSKPDRRTPEGAAAFRDAYTELAAIGPADAKMYLSTMIDSYTLLADALDPASPTRSESRNAAIKMEELRRNTELILLDSTIAACRFGGNKKAEEVK